MYNEYIDELIYNLKETKFYNKSGDTYSDYDEAMDRLVGMFLEVKASGKKVFFVGNGGSAAIAVHMTADFMKNGGMRTYSMYDSSVTTCLGNDYGYEYVFSKQLESAGDAGDLLVAVSSSGNSANIVNAVEAAREQNMKVVTLSGFKPDNRICSMGDCNVHVPVCKYGIVESIHNLILQQIVDVLMEK